MSSTKSDMLTRTEWIDVQTFYGAPQWLIDQLRAAEDDGSVGPIDFFAEWDDEAPDVLMFNPNHGPDGRFTSGGGVSAARDAGAGGVTAVAIKAVGMMHEPDSGFTITRIGDVPSTGYVIAQSGTSGFIQFKNAFDANGDVTPQAVSEFKSWYKQHQAAIRKSGHLGGWMNPQTNELTFDVVDVRTGISQPHAMQWGREANQEAIFHLDTGRVIPTGGTGDTRP